MASIADLLRYKKQITLRDPKGEELAKVWIKIMGDEDIKEAYKYSRVASSVLRAALKDENSIEYKLQMMSLDEQEDADLYELIVASKVSDFTRESVAVIAREELPKLEEVAREPDAPTLEEQEELDKKELETEGRFKKAIDKYVAERKEALEAELFHAPHEKLVEMAKEEIMSIAPTQAFLAELNNQKGYRGTFVDKECKTKAFASLDDYKNIHSSIKEQIVAAYDELEMGPDDIKN